MAVGRISGPLFKDNLLRNGVNLAFETNLLYLDVVNGRIGINTATPDHELSVSGTTRTTNLQVTNEADIASFTVTGNTLSSSSGTINLVPQGTNPVIYQGKILVNNNLQLYTNTIQTTVANTDLNINTTGSGKVNLNGNTLVSGNLHATGVITADGNITLGNATSDIVTFDAEVASTLIPSLTNTYSLGSNPATGGHEWKNVYTHNIYATSFTGTNITVDGINLVLPQGNILYVAKNGSDSNAGVHENNPFLTIKHALSVATAGTTVYVYPGTYSEIFPMTMPQGVTLRGSSLRSVLVQPTVGTIDKDAFLLNGETTIEDLTVTGFRYNSTNDTGYAFRFANNFLVTTKSPYMRNVSVLTRGSVTNSGDPYGFASGDAGRAAFADGSVANASSNEATMLFHGFTCITPNTIALKVTNGVRIEWVNSFTYFADKGLYAYSSATGFAGAGLTRLRINTKTGTWSVGNTVRYYDTDGVTVLASGTIASISGNYVNLTGRCLGFETITDRLGKTIFPQGGAKLSTAQKKFGTASLALNGSTDYVTAATTPDFDFGTGAFTLEAWVYNTAQGATNQIIFDFRTTNPEFTPTFYINATTATLRLAVNGNVVIESATAIPLNTWTHVALAKTGTSTKMFINGTQAGLTYTDNNTYVQGPLTLGARYDGTTPFAGYIDDVRISKGVARYTSNFTAPTAQLTGDLDTVLLLNLNGPNNSIVFLDNGVTLQDIRNITTGGTASVINFADYSDFGAELRMIGSAFCYGNYGAYADGIGVIANLISHNFAFIGAGKLLSNDPNDRIAANEVVQLNNAHVYYTEVNNEGTFSVGSYFSVNQKTGEVTFNGQNLSITTATGVVFTDGIHTTTVLPGEIDTGNIKISGNTIESVTGDVNVTAASGAINLQNNTFVTGNLDVTGNVTIGGNITIGDQTTDVVNFVAGIISNLIPGTTNLYDLGTPSLLWANGYFTAANIDNINISNNTISTVSGNANLRLVANGSGLVYFPSNNVQIDNSLTVGQDLTVTTGTTSLQAVGITGTLTQTGNFGQTGNFTSSGDILVTGNITGTGTLTLPAVLISGSTIGGTASNTDLTIQANGSGKVLIPSNNVQFSQNLVVGGTLGVTGLSTLHAVGITGTLTQVGDLNQTGNFITSGTIQSGSITSSGTLTLPNITISGTTISDTASNSDLQLVANGSGRIYVPSNNVVFDHNLNVGGTLDVTGTSTLGATTINGTLTQTGDFTQTSGNIITSGTIGSSSITITGAGTYLQLPSIKLSGGTILGTGTGANLILQANGAGKIVVPSNDVQFNQNLVVGGTLGVTGLSTLHAVGVTGTLTLNGDLNQTGNITTSGTIGSGSITSSGTLTLPNVLISGSTISGTANANLSIAAYGSNNVVFPNNNVDISNNLWIGGTLQVTDLTTLHAVGITGTLTQSGNFNQTGNFITSGTINSGSITSSGTLTLPTVTIANSIINGTANSDLTVTAYTGKKVLIPSNDVSLGQNLVVGGTLEVDSTSTLADVGITGTLTQNGAYNQTGNFTTSGDLTITGDALISGTLSIPNITIGGSTIATNVSGLDLNIVADGAGAVFIENVRISDNTIQSTGTNSNLTLTPQGTGSLVINTTGSLVLPVGATVDRPSGTNGMVRYNSDIGRYEGYSNGYWVKLGGVESVDGNTYITPELTPGAGDNVLRFVVNSNQMAYIDATKLWATRFETNNLAISGNSITTVATDTDINLTTGGVGGVVIGNLKFANNTITNTVSNAVTQFVESGTGYIKIAGTYGVVLPFGDVASRPTLLHTEIGMTRFNTELQYVEVFNGSSWTIVSGNSSGVSFNDATDIGIQAALMIG